MVPMQRTFGFATEPIFLDVEKCLLFWKFTGRNFNFSNLARVIGDFGSFFWLKLAFENCIIQFRTTGDAFLYSIVFYLATTTSLYFGRVVPNRTIHPEAVIALCDNVLAMY